MSTLALEDIKVLDFTWQGPGPFCTMILADLGAEVIRVDALPGTRVHATKANKRIILHQAIHRNKRSIGLNLKSEKARHIVYQLAKRTDVIVEGYRPGVAKRLGVDYQTMSKINRRIIYCSISGYGQDGPYSALPGHDINYISFSGILNLIGESKRHPSIPLNLIADFGGGAMYAIVGILVALIARGKTRKGQYVDISLTDSALSLLTNIVSNYFAHNKMMFKRGETVYGGGYPYYSTYRTKDRKYITLGCTEPWLWKELCRKIGREDFIPFHFEPEHYTYKAVSKKWSEISTHLKQFFLTKNRDEWFDILSKKDIPIGKVYSLDEVFTDPQILHRQMLIELEHPTEGKIRQLGIAIKLSETPGRIRKLPPVSAEHTEEILTELGYSKEDIAELHQDRAIA